MMTMKTMLKQKKEKRKNPETLFGYATRYATQETKGRKEGRKSGGIREKKKKCTD
jgi:hypothetical protein